MEKTALKCLNFWDYFKYIIKMLVLNEWMEEYEWINTQMYTLELCMLGQTGGYRINLFSLLHQNFGNVEVVSTALR